VHPRLLARLRRAYDAGVAVGISVNLSRRWHKGNHPGLQLARRLKRKADQIWVFATRFDVPATNNASEVRHEVARDEWTRRRRGRRMVVSAAWSRAGAHRLSPSGRASLVTARCEAPGRSPRALAPPGGHKRGEDRTGERR
jgi:hypothetical protein